MTRTAFSPSAGALGLQRDAHNGLLLGTNLGSIADVWSYDAFGDVASYAATRGGTSLFSEQFTRGRSCRRRRRSARKCTPTRTATTARAA